MFLIWYFLQMQMLQPHKMNINIKNKKNENLLGLKLDLTMDVDGSSKGSECPDYGYDNSVGTCW